jgi:uncharacterized protein (DUF488 family)
LKLFTIGFTKTTAESFFSRLSQAGVKKVIDIRLNNASQLAGFAKKTDLIYFLKTICGIDYEHRLELAPTQEILDQYKNSGSWVDYEKSFLELLSNRKIEDILARHELNAACLLCSEDKPEKCHRRLVAEYLKEKWNDLVIVHL